MWCLSLAIKCAFFQSQLFLLWSITAWTNPLLCEPIHYCVNPFITVWTHSDQCLPFGLWNQFHSHQSHCVVSLNKTLYRFNQVDRKNVLTWLKIFWLKRKASAQTQKFWLGQVLPVTTLLLSRLWPASLCRIQVRTWTAFTGWSRSI